MVIKRLPAEGALLKELRVFGNAKDCCVRMETTEPEGAIHFDMRDPTFEIDLQGRVRSVIFEEGSDVDLGVRYLPLEALRVERFVVDYPGADDAWEEVLRRIREGSADPFDWMLGSVQLKIAPAD